MGNVDINPILWQKVEELLKNKKIKICTPMSKGELHKLIHEFEDYHIELELQNEEPKLARSIAQEEAGKFTELYDFAPSGNFTLSQKRQNIELNLTPLKIPGKERSMLNTNCFGFFVNQNSEPVFVTYVLAKFRLLRDHLSSILIRCKISTVKILNL